MACECSETHCSATLKSKIVAQCLRLLQTLESVFEFLMCKQGVSWANKVYSCKAKSRNSNETNPFRTLVIAPLLSS